MTVHGAKGLEASIVILADTCSNRSAGGVPVYFLERGEDEPLIPLWAVKGSSRLPVIAVVKATLKDSESRELGRLLYVAMTRARDRLYVAGFHNGELPEGCWYHTIRSALASKLQPATDFQGRIVWRHGSVPYHPGLAKGAGEADGQQAPGWLNMPAPRGLHVPIILPSKMKGEYDGVRASKGAESYDRKTAKAKGILIHRLLEVLPQLPAADRANAARVIGSGFLNEMRESQIEAAMESALKLLGCEVFPGGEGRCLAETGLAVALRDHAGEPRGIILGQADRILFGESEIALFDYKSGMTSAATGSLSPFHGQLTAYSLALIRLYPAFNLRAALVDTHAMTVHAAHQPAFNAALSAFVDSLCE